MPRPRKCRRVHGLPGLTAFGPLDCPHHEPEAVVMTVDEYESIRLIDLEGMTQEECAASMDIARTTAQRIYDEARKKLADCLVNARRLRIEGGDYAVCGPKMGRCGGPGCPGGQRRCHTGALELRKDILRENA